MFKKFGTAFQRIGSAIKPVGSAIERKWTGHRVMVLASGAVVLVVILVAGTLVALGSGGTPQATATPGATPTTVISFAPTDSPSASPSDTALPSPSDTPEPSPTTPPPDGLAYADLDGVAVKPDLAHRLPMAVMVDDNIVARPQSGFSSASIVYQAPADGGEDRYMMVFQEGTSKDIGPVRSARPYYVYWAMEYKAMFGHYGGDSVVLHQILPRNTGNLYNMDALSGGSCPYHRIGTRKMPHNAYTNTAALISCLPKRHYPLTFQDMPVRNFRDDSPASQLPASQTITIPYRTGVVSYTYDRKTDSYLRYVSYRLQKDPANGQQVKARNIVVMFQALTYDTVNDPGHKRPVIANVGTGQAIVFNEGQAITATWAKASNTALTRLYDSAGNEIPFVRGEIFMQCVPIGTRVTYK